MRIHKINVKTGEAICKAKDFKRALVAYQWIHVSCKNCKIIHRNVPKLKTLTQQVRACERRLKELKKITQRYQDELNKASSQTI